MSTLPTGEATTTPAATPAPTPAPAAPAVTPTPAATPAATAPAAVVPPAATPPAQPAPTATAVVPDKYELKLPDGSPLDQAYVDKLSSTAKELKLSQDQAAGLLKRDSELIQADRQAANDKMLTDYKSQSEAWLKECELDKEYGGEKFKENVDLAHKFILKFGGEKVAQAIQNSGFGNQPDIFKMLASAGRLLANDKIVPGGTAAAPQSKTMAERWYGKKQEGA